MNFFIKLFIFVLIFNTCENFDKKFKNGKNLFTAIMTYKSLKERHYNFITNFIQIKLDFLDVQTLHDFLESEYKKIENKLPKELPIIETKLKKIIYDKYHKNLDLNGVKYKDLKEQRNRYKEVVDELTIIYENLDDKDKKRLKKNVQTDDNIPFFFD